MRKVLAVSLLFNLCSVIGYVLLVRRLSRCPPEVEPFRNSYYRASSLVHVKWLWRQRTAKARVTLLIFAVAAFFVLKGTLGYVGERIFWLSDYMTADIYNS
jgi:hypothetical protein